MKKHFFIVILIILYAGILFPQAVDIPLIATDGTYPITLAVGLDLTATNGIDPQLGEYDLPSPPPGVFEIGFDLYPYVGQYWWTHKDYRAPGDPPEFPFTGTIEHTLQWTWISTTITISYNLPEGATMWITDQLGAIFLNLGPFSGLGTAIIPVSYTTLFNKAYLIMDYEGIIPVELTSFTASILQRKKVVQLNWTTATETNNSGFEIQKQVSSKQSAVSNWKQIGFVPGFGTTTEPKSYSFIDENVTSGTYKYRLKQIDFDGTINYSKEVEVAINITPEDYALEQNYPNPFNPTTTIKFALPEAANVTLIIYNTLGQKVSELVDSKLEAGNYSYQWNAKNAATGIYIYELRAQNFVSIKKMMRLK
jgi:hypothetical protein